MNFLEKKYSPLFLAVATFVVTVLSRFVLPDTINWAYLTPFALALIIALLISSSLGGNNVELRHKNVMNYLMWFALFYVLWFGYIIVSGLAALGNIS